MLRLIAALTLGILAPATAPLLTAPAYAQAESFPIDDLMRATALDEIFSQFGASIAASARTEDISGDEIFLKHWEATATAIFDPVVLHGRLESSLEGRFSPDEQRGLGQFFHSAFGERISVLERETARLSPDQQTRALVRGEELSNAAGPVRTYQLDELMKLVGAEISGGNGRPVAAGIAARHVRLAPAGRHPGAVGGDRCPGQGDDARTVARASPACSVP